MTRKNRYDLRIVCQLFYPEMVSTGQTLTELAEELSLSRLKLKVIASQPTVLWDSKIVPKTMIYRNITIKRTWSTRFSKLSFFGKLINLTTFFITASIEVLTKDRKVPLLLLTNPPYLSMLGRISKLFYNTTYGVLLFDIMPEQAELLGIIKPNGFFSKIWRSMNHYWYKKASYVVVLSKDMLEGALENSRLKDSDSEMECREKTHIIHVWSDDRIIKPMLKRDSKAANELNVLDKFVIQYSGNHGRFHDIETLVSITKRLTGNDKLVFQCIGEGYKKKIVHDYVQKENPSNIYTSTYVVKEMLNDSLAMADFGVVAQMPGQERVCYPSKLLGIMSSGRAIFAICSRNCEMGKMIEDNELGFVVENEDVDSAIKIINMCTNNVPLVDKMGRNAFEYLNKNFTLKNAAQKYYSLIKTYSN